MKDNLHPEINKSLNSSEVKIVEFKIEYAYEIKFFSLQKYVKEKK